MKYIYVYVCVCIYVFVCLVTQLCPTPYDPMDCTLLCPWDSPGENTRVGAMSTMSRCHALLQGIFPTQGSNPGLPHCRWYTQIYIYICMCVCVCVYIHTYKHTYTLSPLLTPAYSWCYELYKKTH